MKPLTSFLAIAAAMSAMPLHADPAFDDAKLGSIEQGKLADLAVLSDDPLTVSEGNFKRLQSVLTLQAGRIVHQSL